MGNDEPNPRRVIVCGPIKRAQPVQQSDSDTSSSNDDNFVGSTRLSSVVLRSGKEQLKSLLRQSKDEKKKKEEREKEKLREESEMRLMEKADEESLEAKGIWRVIDEKRRAQESIERKKMMIEDNLASSIRDFERPKVEEPAQESTPSPQSSPIGELQSSEPAEENSPEVLKSPESDVSKTSSSSQSKNVSVGRIGMSETSETTVVVEPGPKIPPRNDEDSEKLPDATTNDSIDLVQQEPMGENKVPEVQEVVEQVQVDENETAVMGFDDDIEIPNKKKVSGASRWKVAGSEMISRMREMKQMSRTRQLSRELGIKPSGQKQTPVSVIGEAAEEESIKPTAAPSSEAPEKDGDFIDSEEPVATFDGAKGIEDGAKGIEDGAKGIEDGAKGIEESVTSSDVIKGSEEEQKPSSLDLQQSQSGQISDNPLECNVRGNEESVSDGVQADGKSSHSLTPAPSEFDPGPRDGESKELAGGEEYDERKPSDSSVTAPLQSQVPSQKPRLKNVAGGVIALKRMQSSQQKFSGGPSHQAAGAPLDKKTRAKAKMFASSLFKSIKKIGKEAAERGHRYRDSLMDGAFRTPTDADGPFPVVEKMSQGNRSDDESVSGRREKQRRRKRRYRRKALQSHLSDSETTYQRKKSIASLHVEARSTTQFQRKSNLLREQSRSDTSKVISGVSRARAGYRQYNLEDRDSVVLGSDMDLERRSSSRMSLLRGWTHSGLPVSQSKSPSKDNAARKLEEENRQLANEVSEMKERMRVLEAQLATASQVQSPRGVDVSREVDAPVSPSSLTDPERLYRRLIEEKKANRVIRKRLRAVENALAEERAKSQRMEHMSEESLLEELNLIELNMIEAELMRARETATMGKRIRFSGIKA